MEGQRDNTKHNATQAVGKVGIQESPANAKGTRDSSACMKAHR